ncbi:MAG: POTRA domain-containing protein, partial [Steroidobacteraceae bacterium]
DPDPAAGPPAGEAGESGQLPKGVPPLQTPGVPTDAELEKAHAVVGKIYIDNQNIFDLSDPKDNRPIFRLADRLHATTKPNTIRAQLLFKTGDRYNRRVLDETERILRNENYFYDAWIRTVAYHDGKVDIRVTTKDVWTLNPGFNYSRSGGTNTTGEQLEELNTFGTGTDLKLTHQSNIDRSETEFSVDNNHTLGTWTQVGLTYGDLSDGHMHDYLVNYPFYSLDSHWAGGSNGNDDLQTNSLYDRGNIIDQFSDQHDYVQVYGGWSPGLQSDWVQRWQTGVTYIADRFAPVPTWTGITTLPENREFVYPWIQYTLIQDDYLRLYNHDQILRTEDFYLGTTATVQVGYAPESFGSTRDALMFQSAWGKGFRNGDSTLLLSGDFSGRLEGTQLDNGLADVYARYYVTQSKNWLFFSTLVGSKAWRPDLDNQLLLGGDNGLRGYPLRFQDGTGRMLLSAEQRYFTDWYPFRLFRVGAAVFADVGRTWGEPELASPSLGLLKDVGFGLRFGNARSGLGNVIHVDLAFPLNATTGIPKVQFVVQTEQSF